MQRTGPDSLEGCFIALTICLISTLMYGISGLSSFLFVACITRYSTNRNRASFPFVLNSVIQSLASPFAGYLAKRFGVRIVVLVGSLISFAGIGTCFFAESILAVTTLWGIVFGVGFGCSTLLLPAVINEYFFKHRSKALGISYLGSPIGFLIFPPVFEVLYDEYGLSGTFLFLSGINLHCVPLSLLLKQPNFKEDCANSPLSKDKEQITYLSTNSRTQCPAFQNDVMVTENIEKRDSCFTRYSLEFLWKQPERQESTDTLREDNEQYNFALNKNYSCPVRRQNDILRSYEKINGNCYKNSINEYRVPNLFPSHEAQVSSKVKSGNHFKKEHENLILDERQNSFENPSECITNKKTNENTADMPVNIRDTSNILKIIEDCDFRILQSSNGKHKYRECSAIYFGTNKTANNLKNHIQNIKCQPNFHSMNDTEKSNNNTLNCLNLPAKSDNQSKVGFSEVSGIRQKESGFLASNNNGQKKYSNWKMYLQKKSLLSMYCNPIFIVMCLSNSIFSLQFTTLTTVIIDFAKDHNIDSDYDKFIMMCISIMGLCGMLGFGWVTDGGYMTRNRFASLCLLIGSVCTAVLPQVIDFSTLMIVLAIWCISQSSFVLLIPAILAEYLEKDIQAVAVSAVNVLSGPLYLIIPPLLGYFRDGKGSYDYVFYLLSALSLLNSILVFFVTCMARKRCEEKNASNEDTSRM